MSVGKAWRGSSPGYNTSTLKEELYINNSLVDLPRAAVLITHGIGSHIGRNEDWVSDLNNAQISVFGYDLPGHGRTRKEKWLFEDFDVLTEALSAMHELALKYCERHRVPLFLFGHSMGGLITIDFVIRHKPRLTGVILSAPALDPGEVVKPWMLGMARWLRKLVPGLPVLRIPADQLSRDLDVVDGYQNDPLVFQGKIKVSTGYEMLSRMNFVLENAGEFLAPVLIVQGEADTIVRPEISRSFFDQIPTKDKTWKSYPGMYHEVLGDKGKEQVKSDILKWLVHRIS